MMNYSAAVVEQIPLIHVVDRDDELLLNCIDAEWYRILHHFVWQDYLELVLRPISFAYITGNLKSANTTSQ